MNNFLLDRETLEKFVDELMRREPLDVNTPEELNNLREQKIKELDDRVIDAVFGALNSEQLAELNTMMDDENETTEAFAEFFAKNNVDVEKIVSETFRKFGEEFIGGDNE